MPVCRQCAITSDVGQAFSLVLIYQRVNSASATVVLADEEERDLEEWETVSAEKGYWATLYTNLLVLVHLSNVVGQASLRALPSVPFYDIPDAPTSKDLTADLVDLKFKLFDKGWTDFVIIISVELTFLSSVQRWLYVCCCFEEWRATFSDSVCV